MIDIHSHILPFVDDGSSSMEDSINLVREAVKSGVKHLFLTPHYREPYFHETGKIKESFENFKKEVIKNGLGINLYLGEELFLSKDYKSLLKNGEILTLNDTKFVLVEFGACSDFEMKEMIYSIVKSGYSPIVAHVERYKCIDEILASEIKHLGGFIQVNSGSIIDAINFRVKRRVKKLFENGVVDFVASDAHKVRKYSIKNAYEVVVKKYGKDVADKVFYTNAKEIIYSQTKN